MTRRNIPYPARRETGKTPDMSLGPSFDAALTPQISGPVEHVVPPGRHFSSLREKLVSGEWVPDAEVDRLYPKALRKLSRVHWTPVLVARRVAALLGTPGAQVLDVGSAVGKLCHVGALLSEATFTGVERRPELVAVASVVAGRHGISRARFLAADMRDVAWEAYDAYYLYNPFGELRYGDRAAHDASVAHVEERLRAARPGTKVAIYHTFGGRVPEGYLVIGRELLGRGTLEVWLRQ